MEISGMKSVKCIVLGDHAVGKSYFCNPANTISNKSKTESLSFIILFDNYSHHVTIDGKLVSLEFWDVWDTFTYTSPLVVQYPTHKINLLYCYPRPDVFVICFSLVDPTSLDNVRQKLYPDLRHFAPNVPIFLVGTKLDLREEWYRNENPKEAETSPSTTAEGLSMSKELGAVKYLECSALTQKGLKNVYEEIVRTALRNRQRWRQCVII